MGSFRCQAADSWALPLLPALAEALARRGQSLGRSVARAAAERREERNELIGAFVLLPVMKNLAQNFPILNALGMDPRLNVAAASFAVSAFTKGAVSDAAWGSTLGAIGAYTYNTEGLLGNLFGGS